MAGFKFIDLFCGIGGFRQALQGLGNLCVFSSDWDKDARETYFVNYGECPRGDITKIDSKTIPKHQILCAGFPASLLVFRAKWTVSMMHVVPCFTKFFELPGQKT